MASQFLTLLARNRTYVDRAVHISARFESVEEHFYRTPELLFFLRIEHLLWRGFSLLPVGGRILNAPALVGLLT